ncbi:MAG: hypothetical protein ACRC33_16495 [Gemmataceae bacterium]
MSQNLTRPMLETFEDRDVPAVVAPTPIDSPAAPEPAVVQPVAQDSGITEVPGLDPNQPILFQTAAQQSDISEVPGLDPNRPILYQTATQPAQNAGAITSPSVTDEARAAQAATDQGLRDAVGGSPAQRRLSDQVFTDSDAARAE